jgi:STAS-like domain of unknown function (DUF4325)
MTNLPKIKISEELGCFLSSRATAVLLRQRVIASPPVLLDFVGVVSLSDSFADEFFAILVQDFGHDWFVSHVSVVGLTDENRQAVLRAIHNRCECLAS